MPVTSADGRPGSGARFELDLIAVTATEAGYRARVYLPDLRRDYRLSLSCEDGSCTLVRTGGEPVLAAEAGVDATLALPLSLIGDWTEAHLLALGRQLWRASRAGPAGSTWQRRLMRWRPAR